LRADRRKSGRALEPFERETGLTDRETRDFRVQRVDSAPLEFRASPEGYVSTGLGRDVTSTVMDRVKVSAAQAQALSMLEQLFYRYYPDLYQHCVQNYLEHPSQANIHSMGRVKLTTVAWQCNRIDLPLSEVNSSGRAAMAAMRVEP
jgi:hypothetical protein